MTWVKKKMKEQGVCTVCPLVRPPLVAKTLKKKPLCETLLSVLKRHYIISAPYQMIPEPADEFMQMRRGLFGFLFFFGPVLGAARPDPKTPWP